MQPPLCWLFLLLHQFCWQASSCRLCGIFQLHLIVPLPMTFLRVKILLERYLESASYLGHLSVTIDIFIGSYVVCKTWNVALQSFRGDLWGVISTVVPCRTLQDISKLQCLRCKAFSFVGMHTKTLKGNIASGSILCLLTSHVCTTNRLLAADATSFCRIPRTSFSIWCAENSKNVKTV